MNRYLPSRFTDNFNVPATTSVDLFSWKHTGDTRRIMKTRGCPTTIIPSKSLWKKSIDHARLVNIISSRMAPVKKQFGWIYGWSWINTVGCNKSQRDLVSSLYPFSLADRLLSPFPFLPFISSVSWPGKEDPPLHHARRSLSPVLQPSLAQVSAFKMILFFISRFLCTTPLVFFLPSSHADLEERK